MNQRKFLIDTDAAADDMIALLLALTSSDVSVEAITIVSGACRADQGIQNALHLLRGLGLKLPVFAGRHRPLLGPLPDTTHIMGRDGLGGLGLDVGRYPFDQTPACHAIGTFIKRNPGKGTIVCLGPLTNLALALLVEPALADQIGGLVIMGGVSDGVGNITPAAEFNIWADPEAAQIVFEAGIVFDLVGWDVSRSDECSFTPVELDAISFEAISQTSLARTTTPADSRPSVA